MAVAASATAAAVAAEVATRTCFHERRCGQWNQLQTAAAGASAFTARPRPAQTSLKGIKIHRLPGRLLLLTSWLQVASVVKQAHGL